MPAITRMVPTPTVRFVVSPAIAGTGYGVGWADIDDAGRCGISRPDANGRDHAAGEGGR